MNSKLFPRKCGQFDQSVDKIVHTWRAMVNSIREQYTWTVSWTVYVNSIVNSIREQYSYWPESVDNFFKMWTKLSTLSTNLVHSTIVPETNPEACFNLANFYKLGSQYTSNITFIELLYSWNLSWPEYIKNLEQPTSNNSNTYALPLSLHWDHKIH